MSAALAMEKRGLFLDLDGTLADTLPVMRRVYQDFLGRFGLAGTEAEFDSLNGPPLREVVARLRRAHDLVPDVETLHATYVEMMADAHGTAPPSRGAATLLRWATEHGFVVAVVTSAGRAATETWLRGAGLAEMVSLTVTGEDVRRGKPDPEPYRLALERTGCLPQASLAVEDSEQGALAALRAGLPTVVVGSSTSEAARQSPLFRGTVRELGAVRALL